MIVFGDVHGCSEAVKKGIKIAEQLNTQAIFLGDYIDRGYDSIGTLEALIYAKKKHPDWIFLRGNHDKMLMDLIAGNVLPDSMGTALNGLYEFSYKKTTVTYTDWLAREDVFKRDVLDFLEKTLYYHEDESFIFVHALLKDDNIPIISKEPEELIWNYNPDPGWTTKPFIHGHALTEKPETNGVGFNINTACGYGGTLTGLLIENDKILGYYLISENGESVEYQNF